MTLSVSSLANHRQAGRQAGIFCTRKIQWSPFLRLDHKHIMEEQVLLRHNLVL